MMSSSSAIGSDPAHPKSADDQPAAIDRGHPQEKRKACDEEIADQRQHDDGKTDGDESAAEPKSGQAIEQHEIDRPERAHFTRPEMAEDAAAQYAEGVEQQERGENPEI